MNGPHGPSPLSGRTSTTPSSMSASVKTRVRPTQNRTKKKQLTPRQIEMAKSLKTRKEWDDRVFEWQQRLFDGAVDSEVLAEAALYLRPQDYDEVVIERAAEKLCGYPLCQQATKERKGKYKISVKEGKVYDITELYNYCSSQCMAASKFLNAQLLPDPAYMRNFEAMQPVDIVPLGISTSDIQKSSETPTATPLSKDELLANYVQSLLSALPSDLSGPSISVRENGDTSSPPPDPAGDASNIEGFKADYNPQKRKDPPPSIARPERPNKDSLTMKNTVVEVQKQLGSLSLHKPISQTTPQITLAHPTNLRPASPPTGPAAPHRPILTPPSTSSSDSEGPGGTWLVPSNKRPKPTLNLFGKTTTNLSNMVTGRTRDFV
ncbi:RNA polymerase II associated protein 2, partial [Rhizophlyctis rosea]